MKLKSVGLIVLVAILSAISESSAKPRAGLRGIFIYTYDDSFHGAELSVQEVNGKTFKELEATKSFVMKPTPIADAYAFLSLLDGRCDVQFKCKKEECPVVRQPKCPKYNCPVCKACPICPTAKECPVVTTVMPPTTRTTPPHTRTTPPTTRTTTPSNVCKNGAKNFPDCCLNGGSGKYCCKNGAKNKDCCINGGSGPFCCKNGAKNKDCCLNDGKGPFCCTNGSNNEFCCLNGAKNKECVVYTTPTPKPTKKSTPGPTYLPLPTIKTSPQPTTKYTGTYKPFTGTYRTFEPFSRVSHSWSTFTATPYTSTWKTRTNPTKSITRAPKYANPDVANGLKYQSK